jgi:hypothetical protein
VQATSRQVFRNGVLGCHSGLDPESMYFISNNQYLAPAGTRILKKKEFVFN